MNVSLADDFIELKTKRFYPVSKCVLTNQHWIVTPCNSNEVCEKRYKKDDYNCVASLSCKSLDYFKATLNDFKDKNGIATIAIKSNLPIVSVENKSATISFPNEKGIEIYFSKDNSYQSEAIENKIAINFDDLLKLTSASDESEITQKDNSYIRKKISAIFSNSCP